MKGSSNGFARLPVRSNVPQNTYEPKVSIPQKIQSSTGFKPPQPAKENVVNNTKVTGPTRSTVASSGLNKPTSSQTQIRKEQPIKQ
jgi:hypothetical protein